MAGDISVVLRADPSAFDAGVKQTEAAVDRFIQTVEDGADGADQAFADVLRSLHDLGRQSGRSSADIARDFQKLGMSAEDAEDAVAAIERETDQLGKSAPADLNRAEDAVDDLGTTATKTSDDVADLGESAADAANKTGKIGDAASDVGDGLRSLGDIAKDVLSGDFGSAAEGALDALGGIASAAGIGGAVGGAVASAIGGLVGAIIDEWNRFSETVNETRDELVSALVDVGGAFDEAQIESRIRNVVSDTDSWGSANLIAQATGRDLSDVVATLAGVTGDADSVLKDWNASWGDLPGNIPIADIDQAGASLTGVADAGGQLPARLAAVNGALASTRQSASDATGKIQETAATLRQGLPAPAPAKVRIDDSDVRNYRAPTVYIPGKVIVRGGMQLVD